MRRTVCLLLCLCLVCGQCFAAQTDPLKEDIQQFLTDHSLNEENFAFYFYNISTKETCAYNETAFFPVGELWTLPLNLYFYQQEAAGAFDPPEYEPDREYQIGGMTLDDCHYYSILKNDLGVSERMREAVGSESEYKRLLNESLGHIPDDQLPATFLLDNQYSAAFLMNCMVYLAEHPADFKDLLQNYRLIQSGDGFAAYSHVYALTHIMGQEEGWLCDVARVSASQAYLLVAFVKDDGSGSETLAALNDLLCAYVDSQNGIVENSSHSANVRGENDFVISSGGKSNDALLWVGLAVGATVVLGGGIALVVVLLRRKREEDIPY